MREMRVEPINSVLEQPYFSARDVLILSQVGHLQKGNIFRKRSIFDFQKHVYLP